MMGDRDREPLRATPRFKAVIAAAEKRLAELPSA